MGMQAKAWSSAELKKKTIKDVNDAIESGEIEVGGGTEVVANPTLAGTEAALTGLQVEDTKYKVPESYWTEYSGNGYSNFTPTYNARFFIEEGSGASNYGTIWLGEFFKNNSSNVLYIQMARNATYPNGFMSLYHILEINFGTNALAKIVLPGSNEGTAGQVLGKDANNKLAWITPNHLYQYHIKASNNQFSVNIEFDILLNESATITTDTLYSYVSTVPVVATGQRSSSANRINSICKSNTNNQFTISYADNQHGDMPLTVESANSKQIF